MKIYTRRGDGGSTHLANGQRIAKCDTQVEVYGTVDEVISHIGLLRAEVNNPADNALLIDIQRTLFGLGAWVSGWNGGNNFPTATHIQQLEAWIDTAEEERGRPFSGFILPGGCRAAAQAHVTRTVARRAERLLCAIANNLPPIEGQSPENTRQMGLAYLNRLSDFLFVFAKKMNYLSDTDEIKL